MVVPLHTKFSCRNCGMHIPLSTRTLPLGGESHHSWKSKGKPPAEVMEHLQATIFLTSIRPFQIISSHSSTTNTLISLPRTKANYDPLPEKPTAVNKLPTEAERYNNSLALGLSSSQPGPPMTTLLPPTDSHHRCLRIQINGQAREVQTKDRS